MTINVYELIGNGTVLEAFQTGSRYICDPPVMDTDDDYVLLVDDLVDAHSSFIGMGCVLGGSMQGEFEFDNFDNSFYSYRIGELNLIVTDNTNFYDKFKFATEVAKRLNLTDKQERIVLFNAIMNNFLQGYHHTWRVGGDTGRRPSATVESATIEVSGYTASTRVNISGHSVTTGPWQVIYNGG